MEAQPLLFPLDARTPIQSSYVADDPLYAPSAPPMDLPAVKPISHEQMFNFFSPIEKDLDKIFSQSEQAMVEKSESYEKLSVEEFREVLDWMATFPKISQIEFTIVGKGGAEVDEPTLDEPSPDITLSPTGAPASLPRSLEASWVLVDANDLTASAYVRAHPELQNVSFFRKWPSFHVASKLGWVLSATGTAFVFGYLTGAKAAMDSLYRLSRHPLVFAGLGTATAFASAFAPEIALSAVKYIVIGGLFGGVAVATPVFVVGTTGVFMAAGAYHSYQATKRVALKAIGSDK